MSYKRIGDLRRVNDEMLLKAAAISKLIGDCEKSTDEVPQFDTKSALDCWAAIKKSHDELGTMLGATSGADPAVEGEDDEPEGVNSGLAARKADQEARRALGARDNDDPTEGQQEVARGDARRRAASDAARAAERPYLGKFLRPVGAADSTLDVRGHVGLRNIFKTSSDK
jgi:hypothetical protein